MASATGDSVNRNLIRAFQFTTINTGPEYKTQENEQVKTMATNDSKNPLVGTQPQAFSLSSLSCGIADFHASQDREPVGEHEKDVTYRDMKSNMSNNKDAIAIGNTTKIEADDKEISLSLKRYEADPKDFKVGGIDQHADSAIFTTRLALRNAGYGDFCFSRFIKLSQKTDFSNSDRPTVDTGGFVRSGPFDYTKLPKEVQQLILRTLCNTYFDKDGYVNFEITAFDDTHLRRGEAWDQFNDEKNALDQRIRCNDVDSEELEAAKTSLGDFRVMLEKGMCRPLRNPPYDVHIASITSNSNEHGDPHEVAMVQLVHKLSMISKKFTVDLGQVLWHRAKISMCDKYGYAGPLPMASFLEDRPAVWDRIKHLTLSLDSAYFAELDKDQGHGALLDSISEKLSLETLFIKIAIPGFDFGSLKNGEGNTGILQKANGIIVSTCFKLSADIQIYPPDFYENEEDFIEDGRVEWAKHGLNILKRIMPNTLRVAEAQFETVDSSTSQVVVDTSARVSKHGLGDQV